MDFKLRLNLPGKNLDIWTKYPITLELLDGNNLIYRFPNFYQDSILQFNTKY